MNGMDEGALLRRDPVLRNVAFRMVRNVAPALVDQLQIGGEPTPSYRDFMHNYWVRRSQLRFVLNSKEGPARAVLALYYVQKREQLVRCSRLPAPLDGVDSGSAAE